MQNKITALDGTPGCGKLDRLVSPRLDRAATLEPDLDDHAAKPFIGLRDRLVVVELGHQALGIPQCNDFADDPCPYVIVEHSPWIPAEIVKHARRGSLADEDCLGFEFDGERIGIFKTQRAVDEEMLGHGD